MSVFSKRPLPSFPCSSTHSLPSPTINLLVFPTVPWCLCCKEKTQVIRGQIKGKLRAGGKWQMTGWKTDGGGGWSIKFITGVKSKGQWERTWKVRELGGEEKEWNSFRNKKQIEMQWLGASVPDITHVRNSAAHIFAIFWWETNGEEQNSRKADLSLNRALCQFYHRLQHRKQNDGVIVVCAVSPLHSPPPLTCTSVWTMSDHQLTLLLVFFPLHPLTH